MAITIPGYPAFIPQQLLSDQKKAVDIEKVESHLRSINELFGYQVNAIEDEVGTLTDFIVDDEDWQLRYLVADISTWLSSEKQVLVALEWVNNIDVIRQELTTDLSQDAIKFSPPFDPTLPVNRQYEEVIYDYFGRPKHWKVVQ